MTPNQLKQLIDALPAHLVSVREGDAAAVRRAVEQAADADPADRTLAALVHHIAAWESAADGLPTELHGIHRERLIRWDGWTTTWVGTATRAGRSAQIRVLRPTAARDPILRRQLAREGRALEGLVDDLFVFTGDFPALTAALPGQPLGPGGASDPERDLRSARLLATGVVAIARWEERRLRLPPLDPEEIRDTAVGIAISCLTATGDGSHADTIGRVAGALGGHAHSSLGELRLALTQAPVDSAADAEHYVLQAMAQDLAARRHDLFLRHLRGGHRLCLGRLHALTAALHAALPPSRLGGATGAIGVDLEGRIQRVERQGDTLWWGTDGELQCIYDPETGFDAPQARRLLRARAAAPANPRLQAEIGGSSEFSEAAGRWISAALKLRTVRLLLEKAL